MGFFDSYKDVLDPNFAGAYGEQQQNLQGWQNFKALPRWMRDMRKSLLKNAGRSEYLAPYYTQATKAMQAYDASQSFDANADPANIAARRQKAAGGAELDAGLAALGARGEALAGIGQMQQQGRQFKQTGISNTRDAMTALQQSKYYQQKQTGWGSGFLMPLLQGGLGLAAGRYGASKSAAANSPNARYQAPYGGG